MGLGLPGATPSNLSNDLSRWLVKAPKRVSGPRVVRNDLVECVDVDGQLNRTMAELITVYCA